MRPTSVHDLHALQEFLARVFQADSDAPFLNRELMLWKYWDRRHDWEEPRSFVIERAGSIVAHAGLWPAIIVDRGTALRGVQMIDWAASKEAAGAGLSLVQKLSVAADFMYSIGGSAATQNVLPAFGFAFYAQQWKAVLPLRPLRQIMTHQERNWKLAPRLVRNWMWARDASSGYPDGWRVQEIAPEELPAAPEMHPSSKGISIPRPRGFFEYLLQCPTGRFRIYQIAQGGERKGHLVLSLVHGQARLAGLWLEEPNADDIHAAFRLARDIAMRESGAYELVATGSDAGPGREAALAAGFKILPGPKVYALDRKKKLSDLPPLQFQFVDDDSAFMDNGGPSYWS